MTAPPQTTSFETAYANYAALFLPGEGRIVATEDWDPTELGGVPDADVVYGEQPRSHATDPTEELRRVWRREHTIRHLRDSGHAGRQVIDVHRLATGAVQRRTPRGLLREALLGGAMVTLSRTPTGPRLIDEVMAKADLRHTGRLRLGAGGCVLVFGSHGPNARPALLRAGIAGSPADPTPAAEGLVRAADLQRLQTPPLLDRGSFGGIEWSLEGRLEGRPSQRLSAAAFEQVVAAWAELPASGGCPSDRARRDLLALATTWPEHAATLEGCARWLERAMCDAPAVLAHGDLWPGNVLLRARRPTGVVDWDAWSQDAAAGTDLLQLASTALDPRSWVSLGDAWLHRPWASSRFLELTRPYWRARAFEPDAAYLDAVGVAWWAREVAGTVARYPHRADDEPWLTANVHPVLERLVSG